MIRSTTLKGIKDILLQYGNEYCIIYSKICSAQGHWLVKIKDMESCVLINDHNDSRRRKICNCGWCDDGEYNIIHTPETFVQIDESIMLDLIDEGFVVKSMSDKEYQVQTALGTAPVFRPYLIAKTIK